MKNNLFGEFDYNLTNLKKFYFLEYFYILIKSASIYSERRKVFEHFKYEKELNNLGESRYKRVVYSTNGLSDKQLSRYKYTFNQVLDESIHLDLIEDDKQEIRLKEKGTLLINLFEEKGSDSYNEMLFKWIEEKTYGFHYLISNLYLNSKKGLIIFPMYSPLKLNFTKNDIIEKGRLKDYLLTLKSRIENDIGLNLSKQCNFKKYNDELINKLQGEELIDDRFNVRDATKYNYLIKFIRDFWHIKLLKDVYNFKKINSLSYLDLWVYRAKQLGLVNVSEFYLGVNGKIIYPISILQIGEKRKDFDIYFKYPDNTNLYIHNPKWDNFEDQFINILFETYLEIKRASRTHFVNLLDLRDLVCFKSKISYKKFGEFLENSYQRNLKGTLKLDISLESDKVPEEQKAVYLKREPISISGKMRNIIAIEIKK